MQDVASSATEAIIRVFIRVLITKNFIWVQLPSSCLYDRTIILRFKWTTVIAIQGVPFSFVSDSAIGVKKQLKHDYLFKLQLLRLIYICVMCLLADIYNLNVQPTSEGTKNIFSFSAFALLIYNLWCKHF